MRQETLVLSNGGGSGSCAVRRFIIDIFHTCHESSPPPFLRVCARPSLSKEERGAWLYRIGFRPNSQSRLEVELGLEETMIGNAKFRCFSLTNVVRFNQKCVCSRSIKYCAILLSLFFYSGGGRN